MKKYCIILFMLSLWSLIAVAQDTGKINMAVLNLESRSLASSDVMALSERLRFELVNTERFEVMERNKMNDILQEQGFGQSGACGNDECVIRAGRMLQVQYMIAGNIEKVGKTYTSQARIVNVESGKIILAVNEDCDCAIETVLKESMHKLALKLTGSPVQNVPALTSVFGKGDFYFKSTPSSARVFLDGIEISGRTPNSIENIQAGMHVIRMQTEYHSGSTTIYLEPNEFKRVELTLERARGALKVVSQPFEASIYLDTIKRGVTPLTLKDLDAGEHLLRLVKEGYVDRVESVRVKGDETSRVELTLQQSAYVSVTSVPDKAEVAIDNSLVGTTPLSRQPVAPGQHVVRVHKDGYVISDNVMVFNPGQSVPIHAALVQAAGLYVRSEPAGAGVYINNRPAGSTPLEIPEIAPGKYTVRMTNNLYEDWNGEITLNSGQTGSLSPKMKIKTGVIKFVSSPDQANVNINGRSVGKTPITISNIPFGKHTIIFTLPNYKILEKSVELLQDGPMTVQVNLSMALARLTVTGRPEGAELFLDDAFIGTLPLSEKEAAPGNHLLKTKMPGYDEVNYRLYLASEETKSASIYLQPKTMAKAMLRSAVLPGLGQAYAEKKTRMWAYPILQLASFGGIAWANADYNKSIDTYNSARRDYADAFSALESEQAWQAMNGTYQEIKDAQDRRTIMIGVAAALWLWNIADAAIWPPQIHHDGKSKGASLTNPQLYCKNDNNRILFGLSYKF